MKALICLKFLTDSMQRFLWLNFCFFFITCFADLASAQVERGNYTIGGTAGLNHITNGSRNSLTSINLSPSYGTFLTDQLLFGGNANINFQFARRGNINFKAGPLMRYYFRNMLFIQADYNFGILNRANFEHDLYGRVGYAYFLNEHVALEPYIYMGYRDLVNSRNASSFYSVIDYGIYFSLQVYLESALHKALKIHKVKIRQN